MLVWNPQPGSWEAESYRQIYTPANSVWSVQALDGGNTVRVVLDHVGYDGRRSFEFRAPPGTQLQRGTYAFDRPRFPPVTAEMRVLVGSAACSGIGSFTVRELVMNAATGAVSAFAVDFEHHCNWPHVPAVFGSLQFESTVDIVHHPSTHDLNGDGFTDLWWRHETAGWVAAWHMNRQWLIDARLTTPDRVTDFAWQIVGSADFNHDGHPDLLWQHGSSGIITLWYMNGTSFIGVGRMSPNASSDADWQVRTVADFNDDGNPDLIWHHRTLGYVAVWILDGVTLVDAHLLTPSRVADLSWKIVGTGDFNGDGHADLFWRHQRTGLMTVWYMNGSVFVGAGLVSPNTVSDPAWEIGAIADVNDDGRPDLVWQHRDTGLLSAWIMNGVHLSEGAALTPGRVSDPRWRLVGPR
jgi:hypothetical protein